MAAARRTAESLAASSGATKRVLIEADLQKTKIDLMKLKSILIFFQYSKHDCSVGAAGGQLPLIGLCLGASTVFVTQFGTFVTLRELQYIENYLYIQRQRFGDRFAYMVDVWRIKGIKLPAVTIQPLMENALYGFAKPKAQMGC